MLPAWATVLITAIAATAGVVGGLIATRVRIRFDRAENVENRDSARAIARADRVFDRRAYVYEEMLGLVDRWNDTVDASDRRWHGVTTSGGGTAAAAPDKEVWRTMLIRLRTIGSPKVTDAFSAFTGTVDNFYIMILPLSSASAMGRDASYVDKKRAALHESRLKVGTAMKTLEETVRDELDAR